MSIVLEAHVLRELECELDAKLSAHMFHLQLVRYVRATDSKVLNDSKRIALAELKRVFKDLTPWDDNSLAGLEPMSEVERLRQMYEENERKKEA